MHTVQSTAIYRRGIAATMPRHQHIAPIVHQATATRQTVAAHTSGSLPASTDNTRRTEAQGVADSRQHTRQRLTVRREAWRHSRISPRGFDTIAHTAGRTAPATLAPDARCRNINGLCASIRDVITVMRR